MPRASRFHHGASAAERRGRGVNDMGLATPSLEGARAAWAAAEAGDAFWREHYAAYLDQYPDQFVAVVKDRGRKDYGHAVAADPDLDRLIGMIKARGLDVQRVWVRYMAATPIHLAL